MITTLTQAKARAKEPWLVTLGGTRPVGPAARTPEDEASGSAEELFKQPREPKYECAVRLREDARGAYSVYVAHLPGVVTQGETVAEALAMAREAVEAAIGAYKDAGQPVPWTFDIEPPVDDEIEKWIVVNG